MRMCKEIGYQVMSLGVVSVAITVRRRQQPGVQPEINLALVLPPTGR